jgi:hypothetical protein
MAATAVRARALNFCPSEESDSGSIGSHRNSFFFHGPGSDLFRILTYKGATPNVECASVVCVEVHPTPVKRPRRACAMFLGSDIKMIDVWIPTVDQRWLILPRYTQPSPDTKLLIEKLKLHLPSQPPPRLVARKESSEIEVQTVR